MNANPIEAFREAILAAGLYQRLNCALIHLHLKPQLFGPLRGLFQQPRCNLPELLRLQRLKLGHTVNSPQKFR